MSCLWTTRSQPVKFKTTAAQLSLFKNEKDKLFKLLVPSKF